MKKFFESKYFVVLLILLIIFLRFYNLDADPSFTKRVSDISDEAIWGSDARTLALFNSWGQSEIHLGLDSAPLYVYLMKIIFENAGISIFTLRLLSAISGSLTAILLYFFIKKITSKKQAVLALAMYGLGNAPFIYNRIGHIESTLTLFLFLMFIFWYLAKNTTSLSFLSGICYGLAFLIKFTALFFAPVLLGYWLYEYSQKRWQWKRFFYFSIGAALPIVTYLITFLIPNWDRLAKSMLAHGNNNFFGAEVLQNFLKVFGNNIFGLPTVMILSALLVFYFLHKLSILQKFTFREIADSLTPLEAISLSWIVLGTAGALFSDLSDRRLTIMFVPAIMLISHLIISFKDISLKELSEKIAAPEFRPNFLSGYIYFATFLLPLFSLPYIHLRLLGEDTVLFRYGSVIILFTYLLTAFIFCFMSKRTAAPSEKIIIKHKQLLFQFLLLAMFVPFTVLLRHFTRHGAIIFSVIKYEKYLLVAATTSFLVIFFVIALYLYKKKETTIKKQHSIFLIAIYFVISFLLIAEVIFFPKFTTPEATNKLLQVAKPDNIIFGEAVEIIYGTDLEFIFYLPYSDKFGELNRNIFSLKPRYFVYAKTFDGLPPPSHHQQLFEEIQDNYNITLLTEIKMYPYPSTSRHKIELQVYEIIYPRESPKTKDKSPLQEGHPNFPGLPSQ